MSERITTLIALSERVKAATGPDRELDTEIMAAFYTRDKRYIGAHWEDTGEPYQDDVWVDPKTDKWVSTCAFEFTRSLEMVVRLLKRTLPGWWWAVGTRGVSDNARIAPDYDSQEHGERLKREFPYIDGRGGRLVWSKFDEGFDVDRRPSGNVPLALLEAMLDALIYIEAMDAACSKWEARNV